MKPRATPKETLDKASALLSALLRSPKTKRGMKAAVEGLGLSMHFVSGWLTTEIKAGRVTLVHVCEGSEQSYMLARSPVEPSIKPSIYPSWLEPRALPQAAQRRLCNLADISQEQQKESEPANGKSATDRRPQRRTQRRPSGR